MTPREPCSSLREWTRRVWGALSGRRTDQDLQRELDGHLALAEDDLRRKGHAPGEAARLARAAAGGHIQALEALREQRGLPWLASSWLDLKLGLRLLARNWGLTLVGGLAMTLAIGIAAFVFAAFDVVMRSSLPLDEGDRVVAIQVWDREAGRRRDTTWQDLERWRGNLQSVGDVGAFRATRRNVIPPDGAVELAAVAEISAAGFRVARVPPLIGRPLAEADAAPGAAAVVVIGYDIWQRRFDGAHDVVGRDLRLGTDVHTVVGVMPDGFQFPFNFRYWVPLRPGADGTLPNTGPEGVVFGRLAPGATLARAHAEVSALGILPPALRSAPRGRGSVDARPSDATGPRVVPYTFAFTGDFRYVRETGGEWLHGPEADHWYEVVGVVGNLPVTTDARVAYHAAAPGQVHPAHLQLRLAGGATGLAERVRAVAASVDPTLQVDEVHTLAEIYREHRFGDNLGASTIGAVTGSVLLLSAAGLYALMSFTVAQRRREIGIRSALGARPGHLVSAMFRRALWQIGAGSAAGILVASLVRVYVPTEQVGGLPIPGILPGAAAFMLLVGVLASLGPARRGLRIDPTEALRSE